MESVVEALGWASGSCSSAGCPGGEAAVDHGVVAAALVVDLRDGGQLVVELSTRYCRSSSSRCHRREEFHLD